MVRKGGVTLTGPRHDVQRFSISDSFFNHPNACESHAAERKIAYLRRRDDVLLSDAVGNSVALRAQVFAETWYAMTLLFAPMH